MGRNTSTFFLDFTLVNYPDQQLVEAGSRAFIAGSQAVGRGTVVVAERGTDILEQGRPRILPYRGLLRGR